MRDMARPRRIELAGGIHHVTVRGNRRQAIFLEDRDRAFVLRELEDVCRVHDWTWLSYCLMTNHGHFVVETRRPTLGDGMRQLAGRHAQAFNRRHASDGHLFQGRYGSVLVRSDTHFAQLLRYVALNPVAAGLCAGPSDWRWSSHSALLGDHPAASEARRRVEALLEVWGGEAGTRYSSLFAADGRLARRFGAESPWTHRPPLDGLLASTDLDAGMRAAREEGYRLVEIAAATGMHISSVWRRTQRKKGV
jgi:REP element-mobilizing transposase RayT